MKIKATTVLLFLIYNISFSQGFLNGSFENNTAVTDKINLSNSAYSTFMTNSFAFGTCVWAGGPGDMDIISSPLFCGPPKDGNWFVALTGGGSDAISMTLPAPLEQGKSYTISFYDRFCQGTPFPFQIGLSTLNDAFGAVIYDAPLPIAGVWTKRTFIFNAPNNGQFITVHINGGSCLDSWAHIDNFRIDSCTIIFSLGNDTTLCENEVLILDASTFNASYKWQDNSTNSTLNVTQEGTYWVEVTNGCGTETDSITVSFNPLPTVNLDNYKLICDGETITLDAKFPNATYLWQDNSSDPTFYVTEPGNYWVEVSNSCGVISDTIFAEFENCDCSLYFPNAFTPNNDGTNDKIGAVFNCKLYEFSLRIFNRWGEIIFETTSAENAWDGTYKGETLPIGTYLYSVKYKFKHSPNSLIQNGNLTLLH